MRAAPTSAWATSVTFTRRPYLPSRMVEAPPVTLTGGASVMHRWAVSGARRALLHDGEQALGVRRRHA